MSKLEDYGDANKCLNHALRTGLWTGSQAGVFSGLLYHFAMKHSLLFRHHFNASARTALTVMPIFYTGYLNAELSMHKCMQPRADMYYNADDEDDDELVD